MRETVDIVIKQTITVDTEIAAEIQWLNDQGICTESSCGGHDEYPPLALIKPSSVERARELGYSPRYDEQSGLFEINLLGHSDIFEIELEDGRRVQCRPVLRQSYLDAEFSAGLVEGIGHPDSVYLRLQKFGKEPTMILLRPDEMQAIAWVCSGTLWSVEFTALMADR